MHTKSTSPRARTIRLPRFPTLACEFTFDPVPSVPAHLYWAGHEQGQRYNQALAQAAEDFGIHIH